MIESFPSKTYAQRMEAVLTYIEANLNGDLSIEKLSGIALKKRSDSAGVQLLAHLRHK